MPDLNLPPPHRRRWWVRVLRWGMVLVLILMAAVGSVTWWVWTHPTEAMKMVLLRVDSPLRPDVGKIHFDHDKIRIEAISLHDPISGTQVVSLRELIWKTDLKQIKSRHLGSLKLSGLQVNASAPILQRLQRWLNEAPAAESASSGVRFDDFSLEDASVELAAMDSSPFIKFKLDQHAERVNFSDPSAPSVKHFDVVLRDVVIGETKLPHAVCEGSLSEGKLNLTQVVLSDGVLAPSPELLALLTPKLGGTASAPIIKHVELGTVKLLDFALPSLGDVRSLPAWWPPISGRVNLAVEGISYSEAGKLGMGPLNIEVSAFTLRAPSGAGQIDAAGFQIVIEKLGDDGLLQITSASVQGAQIDWRQGLEDYFFGRSGDTRTSAGPSAKPMIRGVVLDALTVSGARLTLSPTTRVSYTASGVLDVEAKQLRVDDKGAASPAAQSVRLRGIELAEPSRTPFLSVAEAVLAVVPDDWTKQRTISEFSLKEPVLIARPENVSWFNAASAKASDGASADFSDLNFGKLELVDGRIDLAMPQSGQCLELGTGITIETEAATDAAPQQHRLKLSKLKMSLPQAARLPVATLEELDLAVELPAMWKNKRINALHLKSAEVDVGDALLSLSGSSDPKAAPESGPGPLSGWRINELSITDSSATLYRIAPGLPPVKFAIDYTAYDMPLAPKELAGNFDEQRIELSDLAIHAPTNPLVSVADLPTIFVKFTLDGLMRKTIRKIEILSPSLYVGEDLFWYVDWCRKYTGDLPSDIGPTLPAPPSPGWQVEELQVISGKLIIAPKGHPLPGIPRPFPFSFVSKLDSGKIEAELEIPSDNYEWADPPVRLNSLNGRVLFQVPIKGVNNNLTQVFQVESIHWKELHIEKADLSVTYDTNGIYGQFSGQAYEGYVNGAFDVYLDQSYSWDGWISGKGVRSTEITKKMCPEYFLLDGKVDLVVIAQGDQDEVYQCDVKFNNTEPGKFSITALNDMLSSLPEDFAGYQKDAIRIGMETLRDFDYDKVEANARFYGREGKAKLAITGPSGSRNFDVNIFDHRLKVDKPAPSVQASAP